VGRLHDDEVPIDERTVRALLAAQVPGLADGSLARVPSSGTDNAMYRLGADLVVRLPVHEPSVRALVRERRWLPVLAPHLPLAVPEVVFAGEPGEGFPFPWSIHRWLPGTDATQAPPDDRHAAAGAIAGFVLALQAVDPEGGPRSFRAESLRDRDPFVRHSIDAVADEYDVAVLTAEWEAALALPERAAPPVWIHADLHGANLLTTGGRIASVIDFGSAGLGDPAVEVLAAWDPFLEGARATYREALGVDDATWARGRGWAVSCAVNALGYYRVTNPEMAVRARFTLDELLVEPRD
jgi:aminoglycoside phosphotransferase (APT) family kinase protein